MRRKLVDIPSIAALCNAGKSKHVLSKLYSGGVYLKGNFLALYQTLSIDLNQNHQVSFSVLSKSLIQKSAFLRYCFSTLYYHKCLISIYFWVNYKPINKNCHEMDAFNFPKRFCAL